MTLKFDKNGEPKPYRTAFGITIIQVIAGLGIVFGLLIGILGFLEPKDILSVYIGCGVLGFCLILYSLARIMENGDIMIYLKEFEMYKAAEKEKKETEAEDEED